MLLKVGHGVRAAHVIVPHRAEVVNPDESAVLPHEPFVHRSTSCPICRPVCREEDGRVRTVHLENSSALGAGATGFKHNVVQPPLWVAERFG